MARLSFSWGSMNAGKTVHLLTTRFAHVDAGRNVLTLTSSVDNRNGIGVVRSRVGISAEAVAVGSRTDLFTLIERRHADAAIDVIFIDEVQFLDPDHVRQAARVVDDLGIDIHAYGLKVNARGVLFGDSVAALLALADDLIEIPSSCHCGCKATMILRYGPDGSPDRGGPVVEVGGESRYVSVCRKHWTAGDIGPRARERLLPDAGAAA